jgi:hypothetical protein
MERISSVIPSFFAGLATFLIYVLGFLLFMRQRTHITWFLAQVVLGAAVHVLSSVLLIFTMEGFRYWAALGAFAVCWWFFFVLSTAIYVSISARILRVLAASPGHRLSTGEIYQSCIETPFRERAEFLVVAGLARHDKDGYRITAAGRANAGRIKLVRRLFSMEGSGLYSIKGQSGSKEEMQI